MNRREALATMAAASLWQLQRKLFGGATARQISRPHRGVPPNIRRGRAAFTPVAPPAVTLAPLGFPRFWSYANASSSGSPFQSSPGVWDSSYLTALGRFHIVVTAASPWSDVPVVPANDLNAQLKILNPRQKTYWYNPWQWQFDSSSTSLAHKQVQVTKPPRQLLQNNGKVFPFGQTPPDLSGYYWDCARTADADAIIALWLAQTPVADGFFIDSFIAKAGVGQYVHNEQGDPESVNWAACTPPYASYAAFDAAVVAGADYFITQMAAQRFCYINRGGNYGTNDTIGWKAAGELFEGWENPFLNWHAGFDDAMNHVFHWQGPDPTGDGTSLFIFADNATYPATPSMGMPTWCKYMRFILATACIGGGCGTVKQGNQLASDVFKWADEYAVLPSGVADTTKAAIGWLGRPTEFGYKSGNCYIRHFDNGVAVINGSGSSATVSLGGTYRRITGTQDSTTNNGAVETSATIANLDGRLYIK